MLKFQTTTIAFLQHFFNSKQCPLVLGSSNDLAVQIPSSVLVDPQLSGNLPSNIIPRDVIEALPAIPLADPFFHTCALLGSYVFPAIMIPGQMNNVCGSFLA